MNHVRPTRPVQVGQCQAHQQVAQRCRIEHARILDDGEVRTHSFVSHLERLALLDQCSEGLAALSIDPLLVGDDVLVTKSEFTYSAESWTLG